MNNTRPAMAGANNGENGVLVDAPTPAPLGVIAEPLHIQRLEASLDMRPFMSYARHVLSQPLSSGDDSDEQRPSGDGIGGSDTESSDDEQVAGVVGKKATKRLLGTKEERQNIKAQLYNFNDLTTDREWLYDVLMSDTESESDYSNEDDYIKELLKEHVREQKIRENFYKKPTNTQYAYYSAGLLSNHDMFPEHQQSIVGVRKRRRRTKKELLLAKLSKPAKPTMPIKQRKPRKSKVANSPESGEVHPSDLKNYAFGDTTAANEDDLDTNTLAESDPDDYDTNLDEDDLDVVGGEDGASGRGRRRRSQLRTPEVMAARRRRVWQVMAKKEIGRCQRAKMNNHKEMLQNCKRVAGMCMKVVRQRAIQSQRNMKETVWRAKRLTREMLAYWKRYERVERDHKRRMEKEAEEQRKQDVELIEAKRQQRKLNFLITQTELYAHFMSKKLGQGTEQDQLRILNQLDEEVNPRLAEFDDYDAEEMKQLAEQHALEAINADQAKNRQFVSPVKSEVETENVDIKKEFDVTGLSEPKAKADLPQPKIFKGTLKTYQIKGMTWLANLYDQGISGILADEMGLGKTVQSIAFLCHIAERYGVWGPFLIISPASTLHNWQQEMARFVPDFSVVPYWGSPNERKILRQFWEQKDLHTREASFHVVITSYQLIVSDYKYFNRIKWQYMVLDEAQAIKSATSQRWKLLLGFNCRNRLLLSGTPIQNSMAELWALLHFIMPTLFDSHDEFNEWFSKDIESHAENKTGIDERQISRLHMILKPFMLRRIKKDVENELSDKIEIMVYCPLTIRQKLLYMALKQKIRIEDLLHLTSGGAGATSSSGADGHVDRNFTSNLMNLVMQFRKVCNHPELFERRDAKSPFSMRCEEYVLPRLVYNDGLLHTALPSKRHLLYNKFSIFKSAHMQSSLFPLLGKGVHYKRYVDLHAEGESCFSFTRFSGISLQDMEDVTINGLITFLQHYQRKQNYYALLAYRRQWWTYDVSKRHQLLEPMLEQPVQTYYLPKHSILKQFLFTAMTTNESSIYAFGDYKLVNMQETIEHRVIRSKILQNKIHNVEQMDFEEESQSQPKSQTQSESQSELIKSEPLDIESVEVQVNAQSVSGSNKNKSKIDCKVTTLQLLPEFPYVPRRPQYYCCAPLAMPSFLYGLGQRVQAVKRRLYCESRAAAWEHIRHISCDNAIGYNVVQNGLDLCKPRSGWSSIIVPDKETLISDAGKLSVLDSLLTRLKAEGHRVLIYSQMTKMIDLLEEYMWHRKHRYMRLDGSSKISERRDMVADFQTRADIFVFLLSTRAGGLGINLTAADTVIFYDSDWNPTVDQQAMDRAHRLGQTKQVTVYRLICKGTIEERILQRAREKSEIQRMVISGGNFRPDTLKPKEVVSLLLDDEEIEMKYRQKANQQLSTTSGESMPTTSHAAQSDRKRRLQDKQQNAAISGGITIAASPTDEDNVISAKRLKQEFEDDESVDVAGISGAASPTTTGNTYETYVPGATSVQQFDDSDNETLVVDGEVPMHGADTTNFLHDFSSIGSIRRRHHPRGTKRGRPRGSGRRGGGNGSLHRSLSGTFTAETTAATIGAVGLSSSSSGSTPLPSNETVDVVSGSTTPTTPQTNDEDSTVTKVTFSPSVLKRGPGRPRLKTGGPVNRGTRGAPRARRPMGPLLVPIGRSPAATPLTRSPVISPAPSPAHTSSINYPNTNPAAGGTADASIDN